MHNSLVQLTEIAIAYSIDLLKQLIQNKCVLIAFLQRFRPFALKVHLFPIKKIHIHSLGSSDVAHGHEYCMDMERFSSKINIEQSF